MQPPPSSPKPVNTGRMLRSMLLAIVAAYLLGVLTAEPVRRILEPSAGRSDIALVGEAFQLIEQHYVDKSAVKPQEMAYADRKSTRLNSSHVEISYAVFCLKKKKNKHSD